MEHGRLGLNVPAAWWPTAPLLKSFEAAGFQWVQVHAPPRRVLCDPEAAAGHAAALRTALDTSGLRLVLHGPDDLSAGSREHDRALRGLLDYAAAVGATLIVYHGGNYALHCARERLEREARSLCAVAPRAESLGLRLAVENLAPVWPGPRRPSHDPATIRELVHSVGSPAVGMLLDVGHAHITAELAGRDTVDGIREAADAVVLFHVHDNLGGRLAGQSRPGVDPLRLDLHLPPGQGSVPWRSLSPVLAAHEAPLMLEVHPPHRPEARCLATVSAELLLAGRTSVPVSAAA